MAKEKARVTESTDIYREMIDSVNSIIIRWDMDLNFTLPEQVCPGLFWSRPGTMRPA